MIPGTLICSKVFSTVKEHSALWGVQNDHLQLGAPMEIPKGKLKSMVGGYLRDYIIQVWGLESRLLQGLV